MSDQTKSGSEQPPPLLVLRLLRGYELCVERCCRFLWSQAVETTGGGSFIALKGSLYRLRSFQSRGVGRRRFELLLQHYYMIGGGWGGADETSSSVGRETHSTERARCHRSGSIDPPGWRSERAHNTVPKSAMHRHPLPASAAPAIFLWNASIPSDSLRGVRAGAIHRCLI